MQARWRWRAGWQCTVTVNHAPTPQGRVWSETGWPVCADTHVHCRPCCVSLLRGPSAVCAAGTDAAENYQQPAVRVVQT